LGNGLLRSSGESHARQRRLTQPAFHARKLGAYEKVISRRAEECFARLRPGKTYDFARVLTGLTLAIAGETFFGLSASDTEIARIGRAVRTSLLTLHPARSWPLEWLRERRFRRACGTLDETLFSLFRKQGHGDGNSLLGALLLARDDEGDHSGMTSGQARDELVTLFIAGHETTASALSWCVYLLAKNPEAQERVRQEISEVGDDGNRPLTRGAFAEALRLYPPAWILFRRVVSDYDLDGFPLAEGTHLLLSPYVAGRDERVFPEPMVFRPERWVDEPPPPAGAFFPFGLGNRRCLGEAFAWSEGVLCLKALLKRYRVALTPSARVTEHAGFTLRPSPGVPVICRQVS
jgi:cytochrome P450